MQHLLKTDYTPFMLILNELKNTELRLDDRGISIGDDVLLALYDANTNSYSGAYVKALVNWTMRSRDFPYIPDGYLLFGLGRVEDALFSEALQMGALDSISDLT